MGRTMDETWQRQGLLLGSLLCSALRMLSMFCGSEAWRASNNSSSSSSSNIKHVVALLDRSGVGAIPPQGPPLSDVFFLFFDFATRLGQFPNGFGAHNVRFWILISENYARCRRAKKVRVSRTAVIQLCMAYSIFAYRLLDQRCVAFIFVLGRQDSRAQGRREISVSCSNS